MTQMCTDEKQEGMRLRTPFRLRRSLRNDHAHTDSSTLCSAPCGFELDPFGYGPGAHFPFMSIYLGMGRNSWGVHVQNWLTAG
jgi:hypothetical protein